jgi:nucleoside 2-deoxyribosyltransferase
MTKRIYLAGSEVFLATARDIGARKRAICERHGLVGVFPGDEEEPCDPALSPAEQGLAISRAMERVMRRCDAMIVNLTPFRGPSADVGSAYEMGFMRALDRPHNLMLAGGIIASGGCVIVEAAPDTERYTSLAAFERCAAQAAAALQR